MYQSARYLAGLALWALLMNIAVVIAIPQGLKRAKILERQDEINDEYDYVIVGAGTAGLTVADRLSADGQSMSLASTAGKSA